jgi:Spy/CpxP family protein refolding chaperone
MKMKTKQITIAMLLLFGIATTLLIAQPGPPDPAQRVQHHVQFLTTMLNLNAAQQTQATTIFTNAEQGQSTTFQNMKAAHDALQTAVKNNDSAAIDQAATTIGNLTAQMTAAHAKSEAAFMQILNADQQAKYSQLRHHGGPGMFRHGPGPGGPGPGGPGPDGGGL